MQAEDVKTIQAMIRFGGSFVKALGHAAFAADPENLQKIKDTWAEYWQRYQEMANK